ncbi:hypothetical protein GBA63_13620 [Rubrobacter tropicus]|uniref:Oxygen sensor histidine kinase NreB n=1 Tax=Rubrobacter tropicus TaxID=2653851 RepID=A0A6G8QAS0_9ACTN|nr:histidine kinase [Rubrobacter tropicus]QIN83559.1 hypothetical protein GBA63_13620 [Rubrobacter tropicus]
MRGAVEGLIPPDALSVWAAMKPDAAPSNAPRAPLIARVAARTLVGLSLILFVLAVPARYGELAGVARRVSGHLGAVDGPLGYLVPGAGHYALAVLSLEVLFVLTFTLISLAIAWRNKRDWSSLFFSSVFIAYAVWVTPTLDALALPPVLQPLADLTQAAGVLLAVMFFLLFPDGRFVPGWTKFSAVAWFFYCLAWGIFPGSWFSLIDPFEASFAAFLVLLLLGWGLGLAAQAVRYRRADMRQRLMTKWVVLIVAGACVGYGLVYLPDVLLPDSGHARGLYELYGVPAFWLFALPMPVAFGIAMQRYHLFKADLIINRALVYGALTACVLALYVLIVGVTGMIFHSGGNFLVSLFATGLVAVLFAPLRDRLQRGVNRLLYGERDDPYAALSKLGERLETTLTPNVMLPAVTRTVAEALRLPYVAIEVGGPGEVAAETGAPVADIVRLPLLYGGERVGWLVLGRRAGETDFAPADRRLLGDLARQIGVAVRASRLTADLQNSRERLVTAREEERRRLRRDLHDGVGPRLAALTLKIETARNKLARDPDAADLLSDLAERARDAVSDVRRSVHALRPPTLDELGLIPALLETAAQYSHNGLEVEVESLNGGPLPSLPAAVEVAAYHIAQEAMTNVVRHSDARSCRVTVGPDEGAGVLLLEVRDDGRGLNPDGGLGVGLSSMRERAEELGGTLAVGAHPDGGTLVRAELPFSPEGGA